MAVKKPFEIAREALMMLAARKLTPTPDNYQAVYSEIAGVPKELCEAFSGRSREVARAAERFRARYGRAPERGELRNLALENRKAKTLTTRPDLQQAWAEICEFVWILMAGFLNGLAAGYVSHLVLDAMTPRGIPLAGGRASLRL